MTVDNEKMPNSACCDVCGAQGPLTVCASRMGPMSFAYCEICSEKGAEPLPATCLRIYAYGGRKAARESDLKDLVTYINGQYVGFAEAAQVYPDWEEYCKNIFN